MPPVFPAPTPPSVAVRRRCDGLPPLWWISVTSTVRRVSCWAGRVACGSGILEFASGVGSGGEEVVHLTDRQAQTLRHAHGVELLHLGTRVEDGAQLHPCPAVALGELHVHSGGRHLGGRLPVGVGE